MDGALSHTSDSEVFAVMLTNYLYQSLCHLDTRYGLPASVDRVDAVYERPDHRIVFFVGDVYYVLGRRLHSLSDIVKL